jgi:transposase
MKRFVEGQDRSQLILLPDCLDDYVEEDNPVRIVDAFIDELDLAALGFDGVVPEVTGRPAYHPSTLLKIYLYGYLNRVQSSRRLEREAQRNIELMWLTGRLAPDFKTIADFRKDNGAAIRAVCGQFVELCRRLKLFTHAVVAIDGSKFKAVNNRDKNYTVAKVTGRMEQVNASIARYLRALDRADREESDVAEAKSIRLKEKIAGLREQMRALKVMEQRVQDAPDQQVSLTDPDARSMATSGKGTATVGYNVQIAVDAEHHLIVAHEVINQGYDRHQLAPMAFKAQQAMGHEQITALADRGYFNGDQVLSCEGTGVAPVVPKTLTSGNTKRGLFTMVTLRRREGLLHLPGRPAPDQGAGPIRPLGRHRSIPPPDRLLHLSSQAAVHRGESEAGQALETRRRPRRHAGSARPHARGHGRATTDRRTPVWNPQGLDGRHPLPDPDPR